MSNHPIRRENLLTLYAEFVSTQQKANPANSVSGLDRAFAEHLQIANTALSSMKSGSRSIGVKLARQIESACKKPTLWMDTEHADKAKSPNDADADNFIKLAKRAFSRADSFEKESLCKMLKASLETSAAQLHINNTIK